MFSNVFFAIMLTINLMLVYYVSGTNFDHLKKILHFNLDSIFSYFYHFALFLAFLSILIAFAELCACNYIILQF